MDTNIRDMALQELAGSKRMPFLISLAGNISFAARGVYIEAGNSESRALAALRAVNEMMIVATKQLRTSYSGDPAYPDSAFIQVLIENADIGDSRQIIILALRSTLRDMGRLPRLRTEYPGNLG